MRGTLRVARWLFVVVACACGACAVPPTAPATPPLSRTPTPVRVVMPTMLALPVAAPTLAPTLPPASPSPTLRRVVITPLPPVIAQPTPRPLRFDDVEARAILVALFPDLQFTPDGDLFRVNGDPNRLMWINSRAEGNFTGNEPELAVIVAHDAPRLAPEQLKPSAPTGSFLAILQRRDGKLLVAQRAFPFPTAISPQAFDVEIDRVTDFDHDGQTELLITTESWSQGVTTDAAFLYQWEVSQFAELWSSVIGEDNTAALNQTQYYVAASELFVVDLDGDGYDDLVLDGTRVDFARDTQGLPDLDRETMRRRDRRVFRWNGVTFGIDPARVTPMPGGK